MKTKLLFLLGFFALQFSLAKTTAFTVPFLPNVSPLTYCDPNNDGFGVFDLTQATPPILAAQSGAASNYQIIYQETFGSNTISTPESYHNINPWNQTVYYTIIEISSGDAAIGSFQLVVNLTPVATTPSDYHLCDYTGAIGSESFDFTTVIPEVLGTINPSSVSVTFYYNQADAGSEVNPITNPTSFVNAIAWQQTVYVRVAVVSTGCYDVVPLHLVVDPIPQSTQPNYPTYYSCNYSGTTGYETFDLSSRVSSILLGQTGMNVAFYPSLADAQNNTNVITNNLYVNQVIFVQTLGIRITNQATGCYVISTMDIAVSPLPQLIAPSAPYAVCDADQDGTAVFDLTALIPDLLGGASYAITFHETLNDAEMGGTTIPDPSSYTNINPFTQTIYARGEDTVTGCYGIVPIELQVNTAPIAPTVSPLWVCDTDANPQDGTTTVDLTQKTAVILSLQPLAASNYSVAFYSTETSAYAGTPTIFPATNYVGSSGENIWCRVENNVTHCFSVGSFQLFINGPFAITTPTPLQICDGDANPNDQFVTFNLTVKDTEINQFHPNYIVTYYPSYIDALNNTNTIATPTAYTNVTGPIQTLGVRVTTPFGCVSFTTLDIRVLPIPTPLTNPPALAPQCDVNNPGDMMEDFDLTVNTPYIVNGDPNVTLHYFATMTDAENNANEILTPTAAIVGSNVWIRVENNRVDFFGNHCYVLVEQPLTVNSVPPIDLVSNNTLNTIYVDNSNTVVQPLTLDAQLYGNYTYQWFVDGNLIPNAISSIYVVDTASSSGANRIFTVTAQDINTGCEATNSITVAQSTGTPSPLGLVIQGFNPGDTLADLNVSGSNILWYASATNKNAVTTFSTPLPLSTLLVDGTTYYASQTVGGIESIARLPVTVHAVLGVPGNEIQSLRCAPNPVKNSVTLQSDVVVKSVLIYTMPGQKVFEQKYNDTNLTIDLSRLSAGNYILKAEGENGQKTIRIIKE